MLKLLDAGILAKVAGKKQEVGAAEGFTELIVNLNVGMGLGEEIIKIGGYGKVRTLIPEKKGDCSNDEKHQQPSLDGEVCELLHEEVGHGRATRKVIKVVIPSAG